VLYKRQRFGQLDRQKSTVDVFEHVMEGFRPNWPLLQRNRAEDRPSRPTRPERPMEKKPKSPTARHRR